MLGTTDLDQAAGQDWDVVVVGAGPAGSLAARQIARRDRRVLLVDKAPFPRFKVCGCCINRNCQSTLRQAGLTELLLELPGVPIQQFCIGTTGSRIARLPISGTVCLARSTFDAALANSAIESGVDFLPQTEARLLPASPDFRELQLRCGGKQCHVRTKLLVAADGVGSGLVSSTGEIVSTPGKHSRIGAGAIIESDSVDFLPGTIYMACGTGGYVGLVRLEDNRLDIAAALDPQSVKQSGGLAPLIRSIMCSAGFSVPDELGQADWKGTPLLSRVAVPCHSHRALVIGDAAGYVEPFTGEGIAWALSCGLAVAPLAVRATGQWTPELGKAWSGEYRRLIRNRQWSCRLLARGLRHPVMTSGVVATISRFPLLARPLTRAITG